MRDLFDQNDPPITIRVRVTPKAKFAHIKEEIAEDGSTFYTVYVMVAAEDGKANLAAIERDGRCNGCSENFAEKYARSNIP